MPRANIFLTASLFGLVFNLQAQEDLGPTSFPTSKKAVNFYVIDKPKTLDLFARVVIIRAKKKAKRSKNNLVTLVVSSSEELKEKLTTYMQANDVTIGTIWFDSHGKYKNGYSSFSLGKEEFSYKTINDTNYNANLRSISAFCTSNTRVGIGSCYGGATYEKPAHGDHKATRMNGDSLMIGMGNIFSCATIYASESWVMIKPGTFKRHKYALAGYPLQRRFKDEVYKPVWENMGVWHSYSSSDSVVRTVNTVALNRRGSLEVKHVNYLERDKSRRKLSKNIQKLRSDLGKS